MSDADWEGEERWQKKMGQLEGLSDFTDIFTEVIIDQVVIPELKEQFASEGRGRWAPLSPAYARRKQRLYGDRPILQATGEMMRAFTVPGAPHQVRETGPDAAFFGVDLERARFHQRSRGKQRRVIITATPQLRKKVRDSAQKKVQEKAKRIARG